VFNLLDCLGLHVYGIIDLLIYIDIIVVVRVFLS